MNPVGEKTVWEENTPDTLVDICTRYVINHPQTYCYQVQNNIGAGANGIDTASIEDGDDETDDGMRGVVFFGGVGGGNGEPPQLTIRSKQPATSAGRHAHHAAAAAATALSSTQLALIPDLHLPTEICEKFFDMLQEEGLDIEDMTASAFSDTTTSRLRNVSVRGTSITDEGLMCLLRHNLKSLDVSNCEGITRQSLENINSHSEQLANLSVGLSSHILPDYICTKEEVFPTEDDDDEDSLDEEDRARSVYDRRGYIIRAPQLQRLSIKELFVTRGSNYFDLLLRPLPRLTHLDLSGTAHGEGMGDFAFLRHLTLLASLVLHNVTNLDMAVNTITEIKSLKHLDMSNHQETTYVEPNKMLSRLVESLPSLESLDISGTNLAGTGSYESASSADSGTRPSPSPPRGSGGFSEGLNDPSPASPRSAASECDIPGLLSRVNRPLEFLGLYKTAHDASMRTHLPAIKVSGDSNETQILVAGQQYLDRPAMLENVLNDLFHIFRIQDCANVRGVMDVILLAMDRHPGEKVIQISGSASLYYVVKSELRDSINVKMKKKILATLLNGMFAHKSDPVMMRNGCLTLCQFAIPNDVIFDYERLVRILLFIVSEHTAPENAFVQRAGIYLLNSLACHVNTEQKLLVGNLGAMEKMLGLIRDRVNAGTCDDVMETAWSCMWNVTDETPINCKRFLDGGGMQLFLNCKERFPESQDLLRNMMGLLGNVAEVPALRSQLMTREFVAVFSLLLNSNSDGIEVSYNAAGVLAHMASDGAEAWTITEPSRGEVLSRMVEAIEKWTIDTSRNINYRSFEPILRLIRIEHTPQCQHWAVWALANLTRVDIKYCSLIENEGGLTLLEELINSNVVNGGVPAADRADEMAAVGGGPYTRVIELASIVRENVTRWKEAADAINGEAGLALDG